MAALCLVAALVCMAIDWLAVAQERRLLEYAAKPAALGFLLLFAAASPAAPWYLIAALILSLLGDVYLMLDDELFAVGLVAFLLAHLAYIAGFDAATSTRLIWFVIVAAASTPLALRIIRGVKEPPLRIGVGVYMAVIAMMVASAIAAGEMLAIVGALFFYASDALIAVNRFVGTFASARILVVVTYHVAQLLLVLALRA